MHQMVVSLQKKPNVRFLIVITSGCTKGQNHIIKQCIYNRWWIGLVGPGVMTVAQPLKPLFRMILVIIIFFQLQLAVSVWATSAAFIRKQTFHSGTSLQPVQRDGNWHFQWATNIEEYGHEYICANKACEIMQRKIQNEFKSARRNVPVKVASSLCP